MVWAALGAMVPLPSLFFLFFEASWGVLGAFGGVLGASWALLGRLGDVLGASWERLGRSWGRLGGVLGRLGASWGRLGGVLGHLGGVSGAMPRKTSIFDRFLLPTLTPET